MVYKYCQSNQEHRMDLRPIRRTKQWLSVLLKDTSVTAGDSNPHSADQKHQSLSSGLLTARPRYFHKIKYSSYLFVSIRVSTVHASLFNHDPSIVLLIWQIFTQDYIIQCICSNLCMFIINLQKWMYFFNFKCIFHINMIRLLSHETSVSEYQIFSHERVYKVPSEKFCLLNIL